MDPQDTIAALLAQYMGEEQPQPPAAIYRGGEREDFIPPNRGYRMPQEFAPDRLYEPPPPEDPNAGMSAGNENPMLVPKSKRIPDLPPDYHIERRPYTGPEIPMEEFDKRDTFTSPGPPSGSPPGYDPRVPGSGSAQQQFGSPQQQIEKLLDFERNYNELKEIDPRMAERYRSFGLGGPATDSDMEYVYGKGAVGREMGGYSPLPGGAGMDKEGVGRQPVYPQRRRFKELRDRNDWANEADAEMQQEQIEREMQELEEHGDYR